MMAVTLMVVYIYIYIYREFYKTNRVNQELCSNKKECGSKLCKQNCNIFPKSNTYRKANVRI